MFSNKYNRRAKIICTLGPRTSSYETVYALAISGMNVARMNFSHGSYEDHLHRIKTVRQVSVDLNKPIGILQDLQGPKIRVMKFENDKVELKDGQKFTLTTRDVVGTNEIVSVSYKSFNEDVNVGDKVLLDDGNLRLKVKVINDQDVICKVINGGILSNSKGLNLPGSILSVDALTEKDRKDLEFGLANHVDFVALSFVQKPDDIRLVKSIIHEAGKNIPVIAKIEKPQAVEAIDAISDMADAIMIARGDLGVEMETEEVPPIQKRLIRHCNKKGVTVITATQMLESMIEHPRPTRAEATDVANAIIDGTDAVMLSGETAVGKYPVEAVKTMSRIITLIENDSEDKHGLHKRQQETIYPVATAIGYSACKTAEMIGASAIICLTQTGSTARMISRFRPKTPIAAITPQCETWLSSSLLWGVEAHQTAHVFPENMDDALYHIFIMLKDRGVVKSGDKVVLTAGIPFNDKRDSNMLRIEEIR